VVWYIYKDKTQYGPYSEDELHEFAGNGFLGQGDLVWNHTFGRWVTAGDVPGLFSQPPPPSVEVVDIPSAAPVTPDPPSLPLAVDRPALKPASNYLLRHWRGELPLPVAYWVNVVFLSTACVALTALVPWEDVVADSPRAFSFSVVVLVLLLALTSVWQFVGVWRAARNYIARGHSKVWGNAARIVILLGLVKGAFWFASAGLPQTWEYARIAVGRDSVGTYQLRLLRDGAELEIAGPIAFGLAQDVRRMLDAHPSIHIVHLNSSGGRVGEARKLRDLFGSRGLTTYTSSGCFSACTIAYMGGRKRLIAPAAQLGFHRYSFPGTADKEFQSQYEKDKRDWLARGFARSFVDRAFATPHNDMWRPTHRELFQAGVLTGYPGSDEVAISGLKPGDLGTIEARLAKEPLFAALKAHEPAVYNQIVAEFRSGVQQGKSMAELQQRMGPLLLDVLARRLPYASDSALCSFVAVLLEQIEVLYGADPALCYSYIMGEAGGRDAGVRLFSKELRKKEVAATSEIILSAIDEKHGLPNKERAVRGLVAVMGPLARLYGNDILMLDDPELAKANKARYCEICYQLYRAILQLKKQESGAILRYMFSQKAS
jgi:hypothetical protein